jgi:hypothetical protein
MALLKDDCMSGNNPKCDSGLLMNTDHQEKGSHCAQLPNELLKHIASYIDGKDIVEWIGASKSSVNLGGATSELAKHRGTSLLHG